MLVLEDYDHAAEFSLSGFKNERDLFLAASDYVLHYIRDHFASKAVDTQNLRLYDVLEGSRIGVAVVSGRQLQKVNHHLADLLGYTSKEIPALEFPDLFCSQDEYREFSRAMSRDKNEAGWHCPPIRLSQRTGPGFSVPSWCGDSTILIH